MKPFSGSDLVELAIQIEKNGLDFYSIWEKKSKNNDAKAVFKYLAEQETRHVALYTKMLAIATAYQPKEGLTQEYTAYMAALAQQYIFAKKDWGRNFAEKIGTDAEALDKGIGFEKDSILFYEGMKGAVPEKDRAVIDSIIDEEKKHLAKLVNLKNMIVDHTKGA